MPKTDTPASEAFYTRLKSSVARDLREVADTERRSIAATIALAVEQYIYGEETEE